MSRHVGLLLEGALLERHTEVITLFPLSPQRNTLEEQLEQLPRVSQGVGYLQTHTWTSF